MVGWADMKLREATVADLPAILRQRRGRRSHRRRGYARAILEIMVELG